MNTIHRRQFLKMITGGLVVASAPKLIFDMGKNSRIWKPVDYVENKFMTIDPAFDGRYATTWEWKLLLAISKEHHQIPPQLYAKYLWGVSST